MCKRTRSLRTSSESSQTIQGIGDFWVRNYSCSFIHYTHMAGFGGLLLRFGGVLGVIGAIAWIFVDNYDEYNELVNLTFAQRASLSSFIGAVFMSLPRRPSSQIVTRLCLCRRRSLSAARLLVSSTAPSYSLFERADPLFVITQGQWRYIADRLSDKRLYFEETGWADGFQLEKPKNTAFRDQLLYEDEVAPRVQTIQRAFYVVSATTALSFGSFIAFWS